MVRVQHSSRRQGRRSGGVLLLFLCALLICFSGREAGGAGRPSLGFLDIEAGQGVADDADSLSSELHFQLVEAGFWTVIDRGARNAALAEHRFAQSDCASESCTLEAGELLTALWMVKGNVDRSGRGFQATLLILDVQRGTTPFSARATAQSSSGAIEAAVGELAREWGERSARSGSPSPGGPIREDRGGLDLPAGPERVVVAFDSEPPGALVRVAGRPVCQSTPCRASVEVGKASVEMELVRHRLATQRVELKRGAEVELALVPDYAVYEVITVPPGLSLAVDGKPAGASPLRALELAPGQHDIVVDDPCWLREGERTQAKAGERKTLRLIARSRVAGLRVEAQDSLGDLEAEVRLEGQRLGLTPGSWTVPLCSKGIELEAKDGRTWSGVLTFKEGKVVPLNVDLGDVGRVDVDLAPLSAFEHTPHPGLSLPMVRLPGGTFDMGSPAGVGDSDEHGSGGGQVSVTVSAFSLGKTEVTNAQYAAFLNARGSNLCGPNDETCVEEGSEYLQLEKQGDTWTPKSGKERHPAVEVSWYGAHAFAAWAKARLPTEAEWEYACRAGQEQTWAGTDDEATLTRFANVADQSAKAAGKTWSWVGEDWAPGLDGFADAAPVGRLDANDWHLQDLSGNVWEWTASVYNSTLSSSSATASPDATSPGDRVNRGGSFASTPSWARCANRDRYGPTVRGDVLGFRVALPAPPSGG